MCRFAGILLLLVPVAAKANLSASASAVISFSVTGGMITWLNQGPNSVSTFLLNGVGGAGGQLHSFTGTGSASDSILFADAESSAVYDASGATFTAAMDLNTPATSGAGVAVNGTYLGHFIVHGPAIATITGTFYSQALTSDPREFGSTASGQLFAITTDNTSIGGQNNVTARSTLGASNTTVSHDLPAAHFGALEPDQEYAFVAQVRASTFAQSVPEPIDAIPCAIAGAGALALAALHRRRHHQ